MSKPESYIQGGAGGTAFVGPQAVRIFTLTTVKSAIGLESKGIRVRRGPKVTPQWAKHYGLKRTDTDGIIAKLEEEIAQLRAIVPVITE